MISCFQTLLSNVAFRYFNLRCPSTKGVAVGKKGVALLPKKGAKKAPKKAPKKAAAAATTPKKAKPKPKKAAKEPKVGRCSLTLL